MLLQWYLQIESHFKLLLPHIPTICLKIPLFDHFLAIYGYFSPFVLSKGLSLCPISTCIDKKNFTACCWNNICKEEATPGCFNPIFQPIAWKFIFLAIFNHFSLFVPAHGQPFDPTSTFIDNKADRHKSRTRNSISHFAKKKVKCDGPTDRQTDGPTDRRTDGPTDTVAYRVACTRLKTRLVSFWRSFQDLSLPHKVFF